MKKLIKALALAAVLSVFSTTAAFAGSWKQDTSGWWWQENDRTYPASAWKWIDSNGDGMAECYYFDHNGYLLTNAFTPDGNQVNESGAWIEEGIVRQRASNPFAARVIDEQGLALYQEADLKSSQLPGLDIYAGIQMAFTYEGLTIPITMNMLLKYHDLNQANMEYFSMTALSMMGSKQSITSFYTNGCYYLDGGSGQRYKMKISPEDMTKNLTFGGLTGQFGAFMNNMQITSQENGSKILFYSTDEAGFEQYLKGLFDEIWPSLSNYGIKIQQLNGRAILTPEGYFSRENISIYMTLSEDGETMGILLNLDINYNNPGQNVTIEFPSTEGYQELVY